MSKLLKGKRVFLDTQIFRQARFGVASPAFKKLAEICKHGDLILITTSITRREIEAQIDDSAPDFKKTLGRAAGLLSGLGHSEPTIDSVPVAKMTEPEIAAHVKKTVAEFFHDCEAEEIELPKNAVHTVFDHYFKKQPPFGDAKKKSEFPDAFVLEALKEKAGRNGESLYVISEDADFVSTCKLSPHLESLPSIGHFLNLYNVHSTSVKAVRATLRANVKCIHDTLDRIVESLAGEMDAPGIVKMTHRKIVDILDELVISCDDKTASVEFVCFVEFEAWLEIHPLHDAPFEHRHADSGQGINITLEFEFDSDNPEVFEVKTYWAPQSIMISAHTAI
jgi:hypothetical protein